VSERRSHACLALLAALNLAAGSVGFSEDHERASALLREHAGEISSAAAKFNVDARLLAAVVYAERSLNWRTGEDVVDIVLARLGHNSSVGVAQVKVETAEWIGQQLHDPASAGYLGPRSEMLLCVRKSRQDLINALEDPHENLLYAAAYLALIEKAWNVALAAPGMQGKEAGIVATLYSLGLVRNDGSIRTARVGAQANQFGQAAQGFYDSFLLRYLFPGEVDRGRGN
jgi:hypothetical protein